MFDLSGVAWSAMYCGMKEAVFCAGWELLVTLKLFQGEKKIARKWERRSLEPHGTPLVENCTNEGHSKIKSMLKTYTCKHLSNKETCIGNTEILLLSTNPVTKTHGSWQSSLQTRPREPFIA